MLRDAIWTFRNAKTCGTVDGSEILHLGDLGCIKTLWIMGYLLHQLVKRRISESSTHYLWCLIMDFKGGLQCFKLGTGWSCPCVVPVNGLQYWPTWRQRKVCWLEDWLTVGWHVQPGIFWDEKETGKKTVGVLGYWSPSRFFWQI